MLRAASEGDLEGTILSLVIVAIVALAVYGVCWLAGRPDVGRIGAAIVAVLGGILVLVDAND